MWLFVTLNCFVFRNRVKRTRSIITCCIYYDDGCIIISSTYTSGKNASIFILLFFFFFFFFLLKLKHKMRPHLKKQFYFQNLRRFWILPWSEKFKEIENRVCLIVCRRYWHLLYKLIYFLVPSTKIYCYSTIHDSLQLSKYRRSAVVQLVSFCAFVSSSE